MAKKPKNIIPLAILISILFLIVYKMAIRQDSISDFILILTSIIVFWYTYETSKIREYEKTIAEASQENLKHIRLPKIQRSVFIYENDVMDIRIRVANISNNPVAVRIVCKVDINGNDTGFISNDYNGKKYWNLQLSEVKEGHFKIVDILKKAKIISKDDYRYVIKERQTKRFKELQRRIGETNSINDLNP